MQLSSRNPFTVSISRRPKPFAFLKNVFSVLSAVSSMLFCINIFYHTIEFLENDLALECQFWCQLPVVNCPFCRKQYKFLYFFPLSKSTVSFLDLTLKFSYDLRVFHGFLLINIRNSFMFAPIFKYIKSRNNQCRWETLI